MMSRCGRCIASTAATLLVAGCTRVHPPAPPVVLPAEGGGPTAAWGRVLDRAVDEQGRIDFGAVAADPADLGAFVGWVATTSPSSDPAQFPSRSERLAYYLNAYNALAMYGVLYSGRIPEQRIRFFLLTGYAVGGQALSLYALENHVIRPLGEPRVHFALNCMVRGCPRLPREPFEPARLDVQLDREARRFLNEDRNVQVDAVAHVVRLSSILKWYKDDFLTVAPSLVGYVNRYREVPVPAEYRVEFLKYDWRLNDSRDSRDNSDDSP